MGEAPTDVVHAAGAPRVAKHSAGAPTLVSIAGDVALTDIDSAQAAHAALPAGAGRLGELAEWLSGTQGGWPPTAPVRPRLVCPSPGTAAAVAVAESLDVGVDHLEITLTADAFRTGVAAADALADAGTNLVILADGESSAAAAVLVAVVTDAEPVALLPRGADALDTDWWITRAAQLRDGRRRAVSRRDDPDDLLDALGNPALATTCGFLIRAVARRTAVVLDGTTAVAAAALCLRARERAGRWWRIADTSTDPVHRRAVEYLDQRPLLDLDVRHGEGLAGLLTIGLLRAAGQFGQLAGADEPGSETPRD
ncbi:MAG TPA: nicotinate-nucleotide--dimethylbenzimidazole phosphoribosyltransferase [Jatrophihabitans sp.]|nr:nicotinate-nucleotide--dimethylbenzimidazole phosphoribosyltransferase [Jatrophihabitans sp.]